MGRAPRVAAGGHVKPKAKRGRPAKRAVWDAAPSPSTLTASTANKFRADVRDSLPPRALDIAAYWFDHYYGTGGTLRDAKHVPGSRAAGIANHATAEKFKLTKVRVSQIIRAVETAADKLREWDEQSDILPDITPQDAQNLTQRLMTMTVAAAQARTLERQHREKLATAETRAQDAEKQLKELQAAVRSVLKEGHQQVSPAAYRALAPLVPGVPDQPIKRN